MVVGIGADTQELLTRFYYFFLRDIYYSNIDLRIMNIENKLGCFFLND